MKIVAFAIVLVCCTQIQLNNCQQTCSQSMIDLVFVVDSSGSIDRNSGGVNKNYNLIKDFMISMVDLVWIGANTTRIGVVIFSHTAENVFYLNTHLSKDDINAAIRGMKYLNSNTNTSGGIRTMQNEQFTLVHGDRSGADNIAIVITDGESTIDKHLTIPSAEQARGDNIQLYSVGITQSINETELKAISSMPQRLNENYFISPNFTTLNDLRSIFEDSLNLSTCTTPAPAPTPIACDTGLVDLVLLVDSSGSIRDKNPTDGSYDNYDLVKQFIIDIINLLDIDSGRARVGLVLFSTQASVQFHLNEKSNKTSMIRFINSELPFIGGHTNTSGALRVMMDQVFILQNGDRPNVPNIAMIITDGVSTIDKNRTLSDAQVAHNVGVQIYSIGITDDVKESEIKGLSSAPKLKDQNYFLSTDFQALGTIVNRIQIGSCSQNTSLPGSCINGLNDVVFLIDSSGSICNNDISFIGTGGCQNFKLLLTFVSDIISALSVNNNDTRIGLVLFSNSAENIFYLNTYYSQQDMINRVGSLTYVGGNTNTSGALRIMKDDQFSSPNGDRSTGKNIGIVITDGESTADADRTISDANAAKAAGIKLYAIGITDAVNVNELKEISSAPQEINRNYYQSTDFSTLNELVNVLISGGCQQVAPSPTPTPDTTKDLTVAYILILVAVIIFLTGLRIAIYFCRKTMYRIIDEDKQLLYRQ